MKRITRITALLAMAAVLLLLSACGREEAPLPISTAAPDRMPPVAKSELAIPGVVADPSAELAALEPAAPQLPTAAEEAPAAEPTGEPTGEPSGEPAPTPTAEPTPKVTPVPPPTIVTAPVPTPAPVEAEALRPGTYEGADGSVLTVNRDGTCTFVTQVSGKINGKAMSADLTFHGVVEAGEFAFDKVTYGAIDLTGIAAAAGYTDAAPWEACAAIIYGAG